MLEQKDLDMLRDLIVLYIKEDFEKKHLSGNLINTIYSEPTEKGLKIVIPAQVYNMFIYQTKGIIIYNSTKSYASELDRKGSEFYIYTRLPNGSYQKKLIKPHNHKGFVNNAINKAITTFSKQLEGKYKIEVK